LIDSGIPIAGKVADLDRMLEAEVEAIFARMRGAS